MTTKANTKLVPGKKATKESAIGAAFRQGAASGKLSLNGRNIGDQQVNEIIKNLKLNNTLFELDLSSNKITDTGVLHLAKAICESTIETLNLSGNKISDKCME